MIEIFLVVSLLNNAPRIEIFQTESGACAELEQLESARVYRVTYDKWKKTSEVKEGICKPIKQFFGVKKD